MNKTMEAALAQSRRDLENSKREHEPARGAGSELACSEWMDALAQKVERRAEDWDGVAVYRDREIAENIATMLRDLAKDIRACGESASIK
jgi:hypothetical protein